MSLLGHWSFNENDVANVYDYSTNGNEPTDITDFAVVASELGFAGRFNGNSTELEFGNIAGVGGTDEVSVFCKFNKDLNQVQYLIHKNLNYRMYLGAAGNLIFGVYIEGGWHEVGSGVLDNGTWFNALGVYDGSDIYLYIEGVEVISAMRAGNMDASTAPVFIGSDSNDFFDGDIELVEVWDSAHNEDEALAHSNNPVGIKYKTLRNHDLLLGDLISTNIYEVSPINMVVTYVDDTDTYRAVPISGAINFGQTPVRRGNIYQTARQWIAEFLITGGDPVLQIYDGITDFSAVIASQKRVEITKDIIAKDNIDLLKLALLGN